MSRYESCAKPSIGRNWAVAALLFLSLLLVKILEGADNFFIVR